MEIRIKINHNEAKYINKPKHTNENHNTKIR